MRGSLVWVVIIIGALIALLVFLVAINDVLQIPFIDSLKGYKDTLIGILGACGVAILFFIIKSRNE